MVQCACLSFVYIRYTPIVHVMAVPSNGKQGEINYGSCKWFNSTKGFGFITPDDGSSDVFVHQSSIQAEGFRSLAEGERVEYTIEVDKRSGKVKANMVTGPDGGNVKGAPKKKYGRGSQSRFGHDYHSNKRNNSQVHMGQQMYHDPNGYSGMMPYMSPMTYVPHQQQAQYPVMPYGNLGLLKILNIDPDFIAISCPRCIVQDMSKVTVHRCTVLRGGFIELVKDIQKVRCDKAFGANRHALSVFAAYGQSPGLYSPTNTAGMSCFCCISVQLMMYSAGVPPDVQGAPQAYENGTE